MRALYYWLFYAIYHFDPFGSQEWDKRWKALWLMVMLQYSVLMTIDFRLGAAGMQPLLIALPRWLIGLVGAALAVLNYFLLLHHERWERYCKEYDRIPSSRRKWWIRTTWVGVAVLFAFMVYSGLEYSQSPVAPSVRVRPLR